MDNIGKLKAIYGKDATIEQLLALGETIGDLDAEYEKLPKTVRVICNGLIEARTAMVILKQLNHRGIMVNCDIENRTAVSIRFVDKPIYKDVEFQEFYDNTFDYISTAVREITPINSLRQEIKRDRNLKAKK